MANGKLGFDESPSKGSGGERPQAVTGKADNYFLLKRLAQSEICFYSWEEHNIISVIESLTTGRETERHRSLKALSIDWALEQGLALVGPEVAIPHRRFRVDVAACSPVWKAPPRKPLTTLTSVLKVAAIFECKQSRGDFLRDNKQRPELVSRIKTLEARRIRLERLLGLDMPHLTKGELLFPEMECTWLRDHNHYGYNKVINELTSLKQALRFNTKFDRLRSYRIANLHYVVAEENLMESSHVPLGWGLLVRRNDQLELVEKPLWQDIGLLEQLLFLQRIAARKTPSKKFKADSKAL